MEKLYYIVDIDRCWGCKSCQTACRIEHSYQAKDTAPIEVFRIESELKNDAIACDFVPMLCMHCDEPACLPVCPKNAISKGADGLVQVDKELCIGCGLCAKACPYEAVQVGMLGDGKKAVKCDLCAARRARGFLPSCEQHCLGEAFTSCNAAEKDRLLQNRRYTFSAGQVVYVSDRLPDLGKAL